MATHNRTGEAMNALKAAFSPEVATTGPREAIVFIDEPAAEREATEAELAGMGENTRYLYGDGDVYWSRALYALLTEALKTDVEYIVHINTDVTITASIDGIFATFRQDPRVAAATGLLMGKVPITGYKPVRAWFPFFRSVRPGADAAILPASFIVYRASALRATGVGLTRINEYRHGWADVELSLQLREIGFRLATVADEVCHVNHTRYFRRRHNFGAYGGSLLTYIRRCPTAPCLEDTKRIGQRLFGRFWPVLLRIYVPVTLHWVRYRAQRGGR